MALAHEPREFVRESGVGLGEALELRREHRTRIAEPRTNQRTPEQGALLGERTLGAASRSLEGGADAFPQACRFGSDEFGRARRRRRVDVGRKIAQLLIDVMADGRDNRMPCVHDGPHDALVAEDEEIFERTAAAC